MDILRASGLVYMQDYNRFCNTFAFIRQPLRKPSVILTVGALVQTEFYDSSATYPQSRWWDRINTEIPDFVQI